MAAIVGIDLGTTNSVVAARNAYGRPEVIANREGRNITPSVVYFGTDPPAVGDEAKEWARLGNDEIASFFKPHMGNPTYRLQFGGRDYDASDLSALVLGRLKADAEPGSGTTVDRAVITVPAYFADAQRKATIEAGRAAGLEVARIINEPTAAALAYGLGTVGARGDRPDLRPRRRDVRRDRGPDLPDEVAVLATAGDHDLGGKNWDDRIASYLAEKFEADTGVDPLDDPVALNEVLSLAEQAKWSLSERASARITLQLGPHRKAYELTRAEFEAMTFALMDRTRRLTEEALGESGLTWPRLSGVLLVGGSTRMPMVRSFVREMAGQDPRSGVNVDEVVALGAAIQASIEAGEGPARRQADAHPGRVARRALAHPGRGPAGGRRHVAQPGRGGGQPRGRPLRQRRDRPPEPADPRRGFQALPPRDPRRGQCTARSLPDPGGERPASRLRGARQVRLLGDPGHRRRGDGRRPDVVRPQRRGPGPGPSSATPATP